MQIEELDFIRQHNYFKDKNFREIDAPELHKHLIKCSSRLRRAQNCVVGLVYEAVQRKLYEADGCLTGREYFNKLGITKHIYQAGMYIGRQIENLPIIKYFFMNGQIEWTKLKLVCRFIKEDDQKWWLEQISELSRSDLDKLLIAKGYKFTPSEKPPEALTTLRVQNRVRKQFIREFREAAENNSCIKNHTMFLAKLISCWRQLQKEEKAEVCKTQDNNDECDDTKMEQVKLDALLLKAFEASIRQVQRALERVNGDWSKIQIPRSIPNHVKEYVLAATSGLCSVPGCNCRVEIFHHLDRFAQLKFHSPRLIAGLCDGHAGLIDSGKVSQESLGLPAPNDPKAARQIDEIHRKIRKEAKIRKLVESDDWQESIRKRRETGPGTEEAVG